ncbi:unnamed protein product [Rotaria sp. Silwood2]|nr:unnamed protein product [Rotaria sp. Silwood2]CAF2725449.1 unnamed protein product [Rotaria sp. Silwood2]CAF2980811.1 unnamed protein product [Rotaria sp. Silwood2]CAF3144847.1 unnamed protein product [Rotaria sp. Silwood2]CAF3924899.1 unnamed protein product [Rotaria sp. Silwood2]
MSWNNTTTINGTSARIFYILDFIKQEFIVYLPLIFISFGVIGFIGNAFTFLQPSLRFNNCCIYLLCGSLVDVMNLFINLLMNYLNVTTGYILSLITVRHLCKLKIFSLVFLPQLSINFLALSLIDRFACTCSLTSSIRHIRRLKMIPWIIVIIIAISGISSFYAPIYYDIVPNLGCVCTNRLFNAVLYIIVHGFITPFFMSIFVLLTYRNVQLSRHRAGLKNLANIDRSRNPFIRMIFTQVFTTSFLTLQWIIFYIYHLIVVDNIKSDEQHTVHYFVWYVSNNIYYLINVKSFYLSTLTSRSFRKTFLGALFQLLSCRQQRQNNIKYSEYFTNTSSKTKTDDKSQYEM